MCLELHSPALFLFSASAIRFDDFVCDETISAAAPPTRRKVRQNRSRLYIILFLFIPAVNLARSSANCENSIAKKCKAFIIFSAPFFALATSGRPNMHKSAEILLFPLAGYRGVEKGGKHLVAASLPLLLCLLCVGCSASAALTWPRLAIRRFLLREPRSELLLAIRHVVIVGKRQTVAHPSKVLGTGFRYGFRGARSSRTTQQN